MGKKLTLTSSSRSLSVVLEEGGPLCAASGDAALAGATFPRLLRSMPPQEMQGRPGQPSGKPQQTSPEAAEAACSLQNAAPAFQKVCQACTTSLDASADHMF